MIQKIRYLCSIQIGMLIQWLKKSWITTFETPNSSWNYPKLCLRCRVGLFIPEWYTNKITIIDFTIYTQFLFLKLKIVVDGPILHSKSIVDRPILHSNSIVDGPILHSWSVVDGPIFHSKSVVDGPILHSKSIVDGSILHCKAKVCILVFLW